MAQRTAAIMPMPLMVLPLCCRGQAPGIPSLYAERMMTLSRIYGFWKYVTNLERDETRRYLEMFYGLQFRPLAESVGNS